MLAMMSLPNSEATVWCQVLVEPLLNTLSFQSFHNEGESDPLFKVKRSRAWLCVWAEGRLEVDAGHILEEDPYGSDQASRDQVLVHDDFFHLAEFCQLDCGDFFSHGGQRSIGFRLLSKAIQNVGGQRYGVCAEDGLLGSLHTPVIAISNGIVSCMQVNILDTVDIRHVRNVG